MLDKETRPILIAQLGEQSSILSYVWIRIWDIDYSCHSTEMADPNSYIPEYKIQDSIFLLLNIEIHKKLYIKISSISINQGLKTKTAIYSELDLIEIYRL